MKKRNKIVALLLMLVLSMSLAACGNSKAGKEETSGNAGAEADVSDDASAEKAKAPKEEKDPLEAAKENLNGVTSVDTLVEMEMDMVVNANGEEQRAESVTSMDVSCIYDPLELKMDMTVEVSGETVTQSMYIENTDEGCVAYINDGSGWQSQSISLTDADQYNFSTDMELYLNGDYQFRENGMEEINGANAYKYSGTIAGEEMKQLMLSSGALDSVTQMGGDISQIDSMLDELGELTIDLWIDEATLYPVRYEIDMTESMDLLLSSIVEAMGEQGEGISMNVPKMVTRMTCSNYNGVTEISVPEEAKGE